MIGKILKQRYCIVEELGAGGEGHLYLAKDMELGTVWAIKELSIEKKREAEILRRLDHPAIPCMVDYAETEESCYLIMEYIHGKSLGQLLRENYVFSTEEILKIGEKLAEVCVYLHQQKPAIYYGDLKPDNIMRTDAGNLYLVDFGSAVPGYEHRNLVRMGTKGFAPPEQYEGRLCAASDIYALGKTLSSLLGKRGIWKFWKIPEFALFLWKCTRSKEEKRYQSMEQVRRILWKFQKKKGTGWKRIGLLGTLILGILWVASFFPLKEKVYPLEEALKIVTDQYYEEAFLSGEFSAVPWEEMEQQLQSFQKQYPKKEEQRRILLLLAVNAELQGQWDRAGVYYEQLLLYDHEYAEGYGKYGLFLLRTGKKKDSQNLWRKFVNTEIEWEDCRSVLLWKEKMECVVR